ncbi:Glutamine cyclotransferase [Candidatus Electrothrix aarhusensis]|uniref:Glutamine cyclotransferase n=1 Tax=Candidatus Electrothrix aarhusensis TaxID=1859131 RepID=A0A444J318_9BACT|nr:Glutamine cyclotransferase [Candidatus Electrothrix aarhusensis]
MDGLVLRFFLILFFVFGLLFRAMPGGGETQVPRPKQYTYTLIREYPHDSKAFTQGLAWDEGRMYEGTGLYGRSSLRSVDLKTGLVNQQQNYTRQYFAEGITVFQGLIYQLTWKSRRIFLFDKDKFSVIKSRPYPREGWGITHNGNELIVSDGTASLYFLDPETLEEKRRILVRDDQGEVARLNELEYVRGSIYANVWQTDRIAIIHPEDGVVSGWLDLSELSARVQSIWKGKTDVLNGIMYDPVNDRLFVTGKLWPSLFEIKVVAKEGL